MNKIEEFQQYQLSDFDKTTLAGKETADCGDYYAYANFSTTGFLGDPNWEDCDFVVWTRTFSDQSTSGNVLHCIYTDEADMFETPTPIISNTGHTSSNSSNF